MDYYRDYLDRLIINEDTEALKDIVPAGTNIKTVGKIIAQAATDNIGNKYIDKEDDYVIIKKIDNYSNNTPQSFGGFVYEAGVYYFFKHWFRQTNINAEMDSGNNSLSDIYLVFDDLRCNLQCKFHSGINGSNKQFGSGAGKIDALKKSSESSYLVASGNFTDSKLYPVSKKGKVLILAKCEKCLNNLYDKIIKEMIKSNTVSQEEVSEVRRLLSVRSETDIKELCKQYEIHNRTNINISNRQLNNYSSVDKDDNEKNIILDKLLEAATNVKNFMQKMDKENCFKFNISDGMNDYQTKLKKFKKENEDTEVNVDRQIRQAEAEKGVGSKSNINIKNILVKDLGITVTDSKLSRFISMANVENNKVDYNNFKNNYLNYILKRLLKNSNIELDDAKKKIQLSGEEMAKNYFINEDSLIQSIMSKIKIASSIFNY